MDLDAVAEGAANLLVALAQGTLQGAGEQAGQRVYEAVAGRFRRSNNSQLLIALDENPGDLGTQAKIRQQIAVHLAADDGFRDLIAAELQQSQPTMTTAVNMANSRRSRATVAGAHSRIEQNDNRRSYGGIVVAGVAIAAIAAIALVTFIGRAVYVNLVDDSSAALTGASTCQEYLTAEDNVRRSTLRKLYVDAGKMEQASDAFLLQNGDFDCGRRPDWTLNQIVAAHGN